MPSGLDHPPQRRTQLQRLRRLLGDLIPGNAFYAQKYAHLDSSTLQNLDDIRRLPFLRKQDLVENQSNHPPYGTNLTWPRERFTRMHQTSGTSIGRPLRWLDTPNDWNWLIHCWEMNFQACELNHHDRLFFPFSFGPFLGFWTAFEAATRCGYAVLPGGGMSSTARLHFLIEHAVTVVFATPTYALHLTEVAESHGIPLQSSAVRKLILAGEPGGNIPATRSRIEELWGARVLDHYGMTEVGPVAIESVASPGSLVVLESEFLPEIIEPEGEEPVPPGEAGELVITNLGRTGSPLIRYRTGDLVRAAIEPQTDARWPGWLRLQGGILGRADDMIHVRGNNLYPTSIESIVRRFPDAVEYRIVVDESGPLSDLRVEIEPRDPADGPALAERIAQAIRNELLFRADVRTVACGSLPRYEMKARRLVRLR